MKTDRKNFLTESEMDLFLRAARRTRNGIRDHCLMLMAYRHGLRVSEAVTVRLDEIDLEGARLYVRRLKDSLSTHHPIEGDELRAIKAWLRERAAHGHAHSPLLFLSTRGPFVRQAINYLCEVIGKRAGLAFKVYPHMLRHSCGFALADRNTATRTIQDFLGHKNIQNTVRYTATNAGRFRDVWRQKP